eukprot:951596_1
MSNQLILYELNLSIGIITTVFCIIIFTWFLWTQFCAKYVKPHNINDLHLRNLSIQITHNNTNSRDRCGSYSSSTIIQLNKMDKSPNTECSKEPKQSIHIPTVSSSISTSISNTSNISNKPRINNNSLSMEHTIDENNVNELAKPTNKRRDSFINFKETAQRLSKVFGDTDQQIDDKWI